MMDNSKYISLVPINYFIKNIAMHYTKKINIIGNSYCNTFIYPYINMLSKYQYTIIKLQTHN